MDPRMNDWILSGERELPPRVIAFAKSASGSSKDDDEDDGDDEDEEDDEDDEDDDLADMSEDELRAALKDTKTQLAKASGSSKSKRDRIKKLNRELEEARTPKPEPKGRSKDDDDDAPDLDVIRHEAKSEGAKEGIAKAKRFAARADLLAAGVNPARVTKAVGLLDLDDMDLDDDGLDGSEEAIEDLRKEWPELFSKPRRKRQSVAGERDSDGGKGERRGSSRNTKTASEKAADQLLGRSRD